MQNADPEKNSLEDRWLYLKGEPGSGKSEVIVHAERTWQHPRLPKRRCGPMLLGKAGSHDGRCPIASNWCRKARTISGLSAWATIPSLGFQLEPRQPWRPATTVEANLSNFSAHRVLRRHTVSCGGAV